MVREMLDVYRREAMEHLKRAKQAEAKLAQVVELCNTAHSRDWNHVRRDDLLRVIEPGTGYHDADGRPA